MAKAEAEADGVSGLEGGEELAFLLRSFVLRRNPTVRSSLSPFPANEEQPPDYDPQCFYLCFHFLVVFFVLFYIF